MTSEKSLNLHYVGLGERLIDFDDLIKTINYKLSLLFDFVYISRTLSTSHLSTSKQCSEELISFWGQLVNPVMDISQSHKYLADGNAFRFADKPKY